MGLTGLSHLGLKSTSLERTERFYTEVLAARLLNRREVPDRRIWLDVRGVRLEIAEVPAWAPLDEEQRRMLPAPSFLVAPDEVDEIVARLEQARVPHDGPALKRAGNGVGVYFGDPDGNPLSLSCAEGYVRPGLARMTGPTYAAAPYAWS